MKFTGDALVLTFGGVALEGEYRTFETDEKVDLKDASSGSDTDRTYQSTLKSGSAAFSGLHTTGTTIYNAVEPGTTGDLVWSPEGTDTGKPKFTVPAIVENRKMKEVYDDLTKLDLSWKFNGPVVEATW